MGGVDICEGRPIGGRVRDVMDKCGGVGDFLDRPLLGTTATFIEQAKFGEKIDKFAPGDVPCDEEMPVQIPVVVDSERPEDSAAAMATAQEAHEALVTISGLIQMLGVLMTGHKAVDGLAASLSGLHEGQDPGEPLSRLTKATRPTCRSAAHLTRLDPGVGTSRSEIAL